jgi:AhpD family alkylhydroperoxidase
LLVVNTFIQTISITEEVYTVGSLTERREENMENFSIYRKIMVQPGLLYMESVSEAYKDGSISSKYKRLMAMVGALVHGCEPCILAQTDKAIEHGASVEEILEACAVAISLGGTMAAGETTKVIQFLREKELLQGFENETL